MTSAKTHDDLTRLLTRYDHWAGDRQELFAIESETGHFPHPDAAFHSDDDGVELLHEIVSVIRALVPASLFNPLVASIVELHDGDTAILDVRVVALDQAWIIAGRPPGLPEVRYRFARIDAPEMKVAEGPAALAALAARIGPLPAPCFIGSTSPLHYVRENYGRILVEMQLLDGTNVSDWMLANGHATPYPKSR
jgi:hypothetical protein